MRTIPLAFGLLAGCAPYTLSPASITFAGERFALVPYDSGEPGIYRSYRAISKDARTIVDLGSGLPIAYDATGDGRDDLLIYDPPDGVHSAGWLDVYVNAEAPLANAEPARAKRKDAGWVRIDPAAYPGLFDGEFLAMIDEKSSWF